MRRRIVVSYDHPAQPTTRAMFDAFEQVARSLGLTNVVVIDEADIGDPNPRGYAASFVMMDDPYKARDNASSEVPCAGR